VPKDGLWTLYYAFAYPHLLYGAELYANTSHTHLDELMKLNNKILRILPNRPRLTAIKSLYHEYGTLPIHELHEYQFLLFVYKIVHRNEHLPDLFKTYFDENSRLHSYNTHSKSDLNLYRMNTTYGQRCLKCKAVVLWNKLPDHLKVCDTLAKAKAKMKAYLSFC
jgi:hypothetical protein